MTSLFFTDIEGSSSLWEQNPVTMPEILRRHDQILTQTIEEAGGRIIKHTGDGVFAAFENGNPVEAAIAIQLSIRGEEWQEIGELRIRSGHVLWQ